MSARSKKAAAGSARHSCVAHMHKRGTLSADQLAAAEFFSKLWEAVYLDGLRAIDYDRPRIDGRDFGGLSVPARRLQARNKLERIRLQIGEPAFTVLVIAAGRGQSLEDVRVFLKCRDKTASESVKDALNLLYIIGVLKAFD